MKTKKHIKTKIGITVIFTKDLHCRFRPEDIELLQVFNHSKKALLEANIKQTQKLKTA